MALEPALGPLLFLDLSLEAGGVVAAANRYLLPRGADLGAVLDVARATVEVRTDRDGDRWCVRLAHRAGPAALDLRVVDDRSIDIAGWAEADDGGFDLLPGETRDVVVTWAAAPAAGRKLRVDGWNVEPMVVA
jgi:hypothetical protein